MIKQLCPTLLAVAFIASPLSSTAEQQVAILSQTGSFGSNPAIALMGNLVVGLGHCSDGCNSAELPVATAANTFWVYTREEINNLFATRDRSISEASTAADAKHSFAMNALSTQVMQAVNSAIGRMDGQLLTPETRISLSEEIISKVRNEIDGHAAALSTEVSDLRMRILSLEQRIADGTK